MNRYSDNDLGRLEFLELLSGSKDPDMKMLKDYKDSFVYREIRNKWHNQINTNNKALKEMIRPFF